MADLIALFCRGEGMRFSGTVCPYYCLSSQECALLQQYPFAEIFTKGRCQPISFLRNAVRKNLSRYHAIVFVDEHLPVMTHLLQEDLKLKRLTKHHSLRELKSYINQTVYHEVRKMIRQELDLPQQECRYCRHFSLSDTQCRLHGIAKRPSSPGCRKFVSVVTHVSLDTFSGAAPFAQQEPVKQLHSEILLEQMTSILRTRIRQTPSPQLKMKHKRQYTIFCRLLAFLQEDIPKTEAVRRIAAALGISVPTVNRDLQEIKTYFDDNK